MMKPQRKKRLLLVLFIVVGVSLLAGLLIYALGQNVNLFYTPTQVIQGEAPVNHTFRVGGLVESGSVHKNVTGLGIQFTLTDTKNSMVVEYKGILPDLFREGQGIVAQGQLNTQGVFIANQVLAKHDENYMPPEVKRMLNDVT